MKLNKMFPRKYATGEDLDGKPITLVIARIAQERMRPNPGSPPADRWVVYFEKAHKGVVLSRTLAYTIAEALECDDTEGWIGKRITLYPEPMTVAGKKRIAIRACKPDETSTDDHPGGLSDGGSEEDEYLV